MGEGVKGREGGRVREGVKGREGGSEGEREGQRGEKIIFITITANDAKSFGHINQSTRQIFEIAFPNMTMISHQCCY